MATPLPDTKQQKTGYNCEFVAKAPDSVQTDCPVCLGILRDPYQARCCGKCFCSACYKRLKSIKKACPTCNNPNFEAFEDKRKKHDISQFKVYCTHHNLGCQWNGELGELDRHLNEEPKPGAEKEGCEFTKVSCLHCQKKFERKSLNTHPFEECPRCRVNCTNHGKGCHWKGELADLGLHLQTACIANMVACPNKCGVQIHFQDVDSHVETECPMRMVECMFKPLGCEVQLPHKDMLAHINDAIHLQTCMTLLMDKTGSLEAENTAKMEEIATLRELSATQVEEIGELKANIERIQQEKASRTEVDQVQQANTDCVRKQMKTKVSWKWFIFAISMAFLMLALLLQYAVMQSSTQPRAIAQNDTTSNHTYSDSELLQGLYQELNHSQQMLCDCLNECNKNITKLRQEISTIANSAPVAFNLSYIQEGFLVTDFIVTEFMTKKYEQKDGEENWFRQPLFSESYHERYTNFILFIYTQEWKDNQGAHLSIGFERVVGDRNNELDWPVTTIAHIQMLNHLGDHSHHHISTIDEWTEWTALVASVKFYQSGEVTTYFKFSELGLNAEKKTHYLKNDCLKFRVYFKVNTSLDVPNQATSQVPDNDNSKKQDSTDQYVNQVDKTDSKQKPSTNSEDATNKYSNTFPYIRQGFSVHNFTLTEFKKCQEQGGNGDWYGDLFYSHPEGYEFQLNVCTNGAYVDHNEYLTVYFKLLASDHNDMLPWPVSITAHVQLLNQLGNHNHHEKTSTGEWDKSWRGAHRGKIQQFFKISELGLNTKKNTQYLKDDCLKFRVYFKVNESKVSNKPNDSKEIDSNATVTDQNTKQVNKTDSESKEKSSDGNVHTDTSQVSSKEKPSVSSKNTTKPYSHILPYIRQGYSVHDFTLTEFRRHQKKGSYGDWFSVPFNSHPGGYWFELNVETNGFDQFRGEYMSICFKSCLDSMLSKRLTWPVSITAHVQLLNQLGDHNHIEKTSTGKWDRKIWFGGRIIKFFKLSKLGLDAKKKIQYLKDDSLKFRVYFKVVTKTDSKVKHIDLHANNGTSQGSNMQKPSTKGKKKTKFQQQKTKGKSSNQDYIKQGFTEHNFTLADFKKHQAKGFYGDWYSEQFYCLSTAREFYYFELNVCTKGDAGANIHGIYLSVWFLLLDVHDNYQSNLAWPISMTAHIQLLNQLEDHNHHEGTSTGEWEKYYFIHGGRIAKFFKLSELGLNAEKNTQYLKDDTLKLRVYCQVTPAN